MAVGGELPGTTDPIGRPVGGDDPTDVGCCDGAEVPLIIGLCVRDGISETEGTVGEEVGIPEGAWEMDGVGT